MSSLIYDILTRVVPVEITDGFLWEEKYKMYKTMNDYVKCTFIGMFNDIPGVLVGSPQY